MTWVLAALLLLWWAFGPLVLAVAVALATVPRVRWWVQDHWSLGLGGARLLAGVVTVVALVVVVLPDGWLPVPPAPGVLATPSYVGRPAAASPVAAAEVAPHPFLPVPGRDPAHDPRGGHTSPFSGPLGLQPEADTAWFGLEHCPRLAFDSRDRVVVACESRSGPAIHVVDPESMRKVASRDLPEPEDDLDEVCTATPWYLDAQDRAVVATLDRHVLALRTADGRGDPELAVDGEWDLRPYVPHGDCLVALLPDWSGRLWWASRGGLVGTLVPETGDVRVHDLAEPVAGSFAADEQGGVYLASEVAVHRLSAGPDGMPQAGWRAPVEAAEVVGSTPALVDGGALAVAAGAEGRAEVVFLDRASGGEICRRRVFEERDARPGGALVSLGTGVVVTNQHGYRGPRSTLLGIGSEPGLTRVDPAGGRCRLRWTSDHVAPSAVATVSVPDGLVFTYTKRPTWMGVSAWYVTAVDASTGRSRWRLRAGTGVLMNDHHAALAIAPDGSLWTATLAGLVRVRDRR